MATTKELLAEAKEEVADLVEELTGKGMTEIDRGLDELRMALKKEPQIGCIQLDYKYPARPGDMDSSLSFGFRIVYKMVEGLTFDMVQKGDPLSEEIEARVKAVVDDFNGRFKIVGITGDCGFMMHYQQLVQKMSDKPVFLSSLKLAPLIQQSVHPGDEILVLTANSESLTNEVLYELLKNVCKMDEGARTKFKVVGCQDVPGFGKEVEKGKKVHFKKALEPFLDMVDKEIKKRAEEDIKVAALLCECTELPQFSNSLRGKFHIPVFDIVNLVDFFHSASAMSHRFGEQ